MDNFWFKKVKIQNFIKRFSLSTFISYKKSVIKIFNLNMVIITIGYITKRTKM